MSKHMVKPERRQTIWRMRVACWIRRLHALKYTLATVHPHPHTEICNTYYFFTTTIVSRTRPSVTLHLHCLKNSPQNDGAIVAGRPVLASPGKTFLSQAEILGHCEDGEGQSSKQGIFVALAHLSWAKPQEPLIEIDVVRPVILSRCCNTQMFNFIPQHDIYLSLFVTK